MVLLFCCKLATSSLNLTGFHAVPILIESEEEDTNLANNFQNENTTFILQNLYRDMLEEKKNKADKKKEDEVCEVEGETMPSQKKRKVVGVVS